jgi:choline-sulfatase
VNSRRVNGRRVNGRRGSSALLVVFAIGCFEPKPPDVIVLTLDTTRADHLGAYGYPHPITPALDALAREGVVYERAWSTAPWTLPAHASMLTGKHPTSHGAHFDDDGGDSNLGEAWDDPSLSDIQANRLPESEVTLAELLRDRGYATGVFAGGPWLAPPFGLVQGYDRQDTEVRALGGRSAQELSDAALAWIAEIPESQPVHLLVNFYDPHAPYDPDKARMLPVDRYASDEDVTASPRRPNQILRERANRSLLRKYDGEIREMDHHLGRLLDGLRAAGRYQDALIVVVGDHGELFGEHGLFAHLMWHYEGLLRVPLIVRFPGAREAGMRIDAPVSVVDLLPLIAGELGLPLPDGVEGRPVGERDLVIAESFEDPRAIALLGSQYDRRLTTGIRWPWKLITSSAHPPRLYHLAEDPEEETDRAAEEAAIVASLEAAIARSKAKMSAPAAVAPKAVDDTTIERLRELGYIE